MKEPLPLRLRLRYAAEYALFRSLLAVVMALPIGPALALAERLGRWFYRLGSSRTRVARENFAVAFPSAPRDVRERTLEDSFAHFARLVVEILRTPRDVRRENWEGFIRFERLDRIERERKVGRGVVLVGGHLGNWELAAHAVGFAGVPLLSVARPVENLHLEAHFAAVRGLSGQRTVPKHGGMRQVLQEVRRGGVLAILVDQDARGAGIFVPFFGREASTTPTPAILAVRHGAAIVPFSSVRDGKAFRYRAVLHEPLLPRADLPEHEAVRDLTRRYTRAVEEMVRACPSQYLWMHKRWKTRPGGGATASGS